MQISVLGKNSTYSAGEILTQAGHDFCYSTAAQYPTYVLATCDIMWDAASLVWIINLDDVPGTPRPTSTVLYNRMLATVIDLHVLLTYLK